jgi:hypothetical protein
VGQRIIHSTITIHQKISHPKVAYASREVRITSCLLLQELQVLLLRELLRQLQVLLALLQELLVLQLQVLQEQEELLFCHKQLKQ